MPNSTVRLVLDTNTVVSGLLWGSPPGQLLDAAEQPRLELAGSTALLAELQGVLARPKFARLLDGRGLDVMDLFDGYAALLVHVTPEAMARVSRDPDDDHVLACAIKARADLIVSGDHDLRVLGRFQGIPIVTATQALAMLA